MCFANGHFLFTDNGDICCVHILINAYRRGKVKGKNPFSKEVDVTQAWSQLTLVIMVHQFSVHWVSIPEYWPNAHLFNIHVKNVTQHLSTLIIMCFKCIILLKLHQIGVVSPVMWMLYRSALVKRELSVKKGVVSLPVDLCSCPRLLPQALGSGGRKTDTSSKNELPPKVAELSFRDGVMSSIIWKELKVESLSSA